MRMNIDTVWTLEVRDAGGNDWTNDWTTIAIFSARYRAIRAAQARRAEGDKEVAVFRYKLDEVCSFERVQIP